MKKIILIAAVLLVAIVGLTSYSGREVKKDKADGTLIAQFKGTPQLQGGKKLD
ncbi:hypothetical protein [Flavobacterium sp. 3HN19-14]|uniref:hypothetical protein n=1 Tax=Flavobacterium sp. 3HN19-14 TaxID=3448133 RepID=UPI003EE19F11